MGQEVVYHQNTPVWAMNYYGRILEPSLINAKSGDRFQFERLGYFCVDTKSYKENEPVFNRIVSLRDSWAKLEKEKV